MKKLLIVPIALVAFALPSQAADNDAELWIHVGGKHKLDETHKLTVATKHKLRDDFSEYYNYSFDVGYQSPLKVDWFAAVWQMSLNARMDGEKHGSDWRQELRPHVNLAAAKKVGNYLFINRARVELRILEEGSDIIRLREKIEVSHPIPGGKNGLALFGSEEIFVDSEGGQFNQNRLTAGVKSRVDRWSGKLFIMDKAEKIGDEWEHAFVLGLSAYTAF